MNDDFLESYFAGCDETTMAELMSIFEGGDQKQLDDYLKNVSNEETKKQLLDGLRNSSNSSEWKRRTIEGASHRNRPQIR